MYDIELPRGLFLAVAIAAVNRPVTARFKGYLGGFTTLGARHREHLPFCPVVTASAAVTVACRTG